MTSEVRSGDSPTLRTVLSTWWPLAASWLLMAFELPLVSAVVARLPTPEVSLAAWGGVIFPISLLIESPIIMLLAASTALSRDRGSYRKVRRFMLAAGALLTGIHVLVAFTPLYYPIVNGLLGAPREIVEPGRLGLMLMTPWSWSIAYRRFNQGVLIRFDHSRSVGLGTAVRLVTDASVLGFGLIHGGLPGVVVAGAAVGLGVIAEAVFIGIRVRPVLNDQMPAGDESAVDLTLASFAVFYIPLALTSGLTLLIQPLGSAALSRMPRALDSLAVWPVVSGFVFMLRSMGMAYNEVVVALMDRPRSHGSLRRFTWILAGAATLALVLVAGTPIARFWFGTVSALRPALTDLGVTAIWIALPIPALVVAHSWLTGRLVHARRTRGVTEAVGLGLLASALFLTGGVAAGRTVGLYVIWAGFDLGAVVQLFWLLRRVRELEGPAREEMDPAAEFAAVNRGLE